MPDNDKHNSREDKGPNLSHMVKENDDKISLLETGQKEILTQLRLLAENMGKQVIDNDNEEEESVKLSWVQTKKPWVRSSLRRR